MTNASKQRLLGYVNTLRSVIMSIETGMANAESEEAYDTLETAMADAEEHLLRAEKFLKISKEMGSLEAV